GQALQRRRGSRATCWARPLTWTRSTPTRSTRSRTCLRTPTMTATTARSGPEPGRAYGPGLPGPGFAPGPGHVYTETHKHTPPPRRNHGNDHFGTRRDRLERPGPGRARHDHDGTGRHRCGLHGRDDHHGHAYP